MKRTYDNQFTIDADHPLTVPHCLLGNPNWEDISCGNDACPSFQCDKLKLVVYVDYNKAADREFPEAPKYSVTEFDLAEDGSISLKDSACFEAEHLSKLMAFLHERWRKYHTETAIDVMCNYCGHSFKLALREFDRSDETECPNCYCDIALADTPEEQEDRTRADREELDRSRRYKVRIMARGEDGTVFCVKNGIDSDDPLLELALAGAGQMYPEAKIWTEEE